jgi:BASS family bile acid:Na+ symporter
MELLNTLYNLMGLVFVLGTIISMGLSLTIAQITGPLRNSRFIIAALLANFLIPPIVAYLLIQAFSLDEPLAVGLLLVSLAAGAPSLPKTAVFAKVDTAAATGLMVLLVVVLGHRLRPGLPDPHSPGGEPVRPGPLSGSRRVRSSHVRPGLEP